MGTAFSSHQRRRAPKLNSSIVDIVLDLDHTLVCLDVTASAIKSSTAQCVTVVNPSAPSVSIIYRLVPWCVEFLCALLSKQREGLIRLSFYSSGEQWRNEQLVPLLLQCAMRRQQQQRNGEREWERENAQESAMAVVTSSIVEISREDALPARSPVIVLSHSLDDGESHNSESLTCALPQQCYRGALSSSSSSSIASSTSSTSTVSRSISSSSIAADSSLTSSLSSSSHSSRSQTHSCCPLSHISPQSLPRHLHDDVYAISPRICSKHHLDKNGRKDLRRVHSNLTLENAILVDDNPVIAFGQEASLLKIASYQLAHAEPHSRRQPSGSTSPLSALHLQRAQQSLVRAMGIIELSLSSMKRLRLSAQEAMAQVLREHRDHANVYEVGLCVLKSHSNSLANTV